MHLMHLVQQVHAVVLSGGSAFGLESASGVVRYLKEREWALMFGLPGCQSCQPPSCSTLESGVPTSVQTPPWVTTHA